MTKRLYYDDSHLLDFAAQVIAVEAHGENLFRVTLDRTAFYPTGGGQPHDTGALDNHTVVECLNADTHDAVVHVVRADAGAFAVGTTIAGRVDGARRFDHIQQHTAQHILSRSFRELYDAATEGFRLTETHGEVDIKLDDPTDARIHDALVLANRIVWENRPVHVHYMTPDEVARRGVRQRFEREGTMRVIEIEGFDLNPCGGTHAARTGEVGMILIPFWERAKGMTRLTFVAGERALEDYTHANRTARDVASHFSVSRDDALAAVLRLTDEHKTLQRRVRELSTLAAEAEAARLITESDPRPDDTRLITRIFTDRDAAALRTLAQRLATHTRTVALLACGEADTVRLVFARSLDAPGDMNQLMREACIALDGRGGGTSELAQGGGCFTPNLQATLAALAARV
ncbi:MAG: DHHA1 domain-containing protein [Pyrinomonadaceae bacterium MAG19_C2-C3]|nr:DHHA1 domain-containing protein [Pyrinomonadaceae bacterium MAG19_C2-C3]